MKKVTKAVILAAGLGTRMLPASKAVPKEMFPIVDKPALQFLVEEAAESGITDLLIVTSRGKTAIEDHFDYSAEYEARFRETGREAEITKLRRIADLVNIQYVRQKESGGTGHAVQCAKSFVGSDPFAVFYGDDVVVSEGNPATAQLIRAYEKYGKPVAGVQAVSKADIVKYSSLKVERLEGNIYTVLDMIEKPREDQIYSLLSILGRVLLEPDIFDILENTPRGAGGELQLTDAMRTLTLTRGMTACEYKGRRYDMGSKLGFLIANVEQGILHEEIGSGFRAFLKEFINKI